jgi:glycosyltransferase involved in cell wall biosynthesis
VAEASIIVTAYNIERYIEQCLDSIAAQTLSDLEVLVVDDGSTDSTPRKILEFCAGDSRFVPVLLAENSPGGVATAANAGLDRATSPWVGFVDGDDYIEPTMFERLVEAAAGCDADLAMCEYQEVVDGSGERRDPADAHRWAELTSPCYKLDIHLRRQILRFIAVPWRKLYRRALLEDNGIRFPVSDGFYEDNPFHWFSVISAQSIAIVPEVLCFHRVGRSGQTTGTVDERLFQIFRHHDTIHSWLAARGLLEVYQSNLLGWVISQMEWISRNTPPALRRRLFDTLVPVFAEYNQTAIATALREGNKGVTAQRLSAAVAKREYGSFLRTLASRPAADNPMITAAFHLRHSGVRHTALLAARYLRNRVQGSAVSGVVNRVAYVGRRLRLQDVMFGLTVIQQRVGGVDSRLGQIEARLEAIENRISDLGRVPEPASAVDEEAWHRSPAVDSFEDPVRSG